ncbi:CS domain containing protein [Trichomonas vaginalis G3]|uniref:CS domain containing protein n=1 Tax=Trichomonas vaginalis (strain ATCC PRA-98 / G3) TaxID=412133 RepID=A2F012_TRIV3|nr:SGT1-like protein family [Trichomonas vaginalis G3]EAY01796.1 CS domain containing protein [Trichomonas vaginalis G3]KAI5546822.1 SGT1-like protein family [Trichomonas vaginalis G3]|eukprot:XP_001330422.1 CS domain containing protein [Trichomonas vaginalis G3]
MDEVSFPSSEFVLETSVIELVDTERYDDALRLIRSSRRIMTPLLIRKQAYCYFKLGNPANALECLKKAEENGWILPEILILKGQCLYSLQEWDTALIAFETADKMGSTPETKQWLTRVKAHISIENSPNAPNIFLFQPDIISDVKKEFYQTNQLLAIRLFIKDVKEEELTVTFNPTSVEVYVKKQRPISVHLNLPREINTSQSFFVINDSSIELKIKKVQCVNWDDIEI